MLSTRQLEAFVWSVRLKTLSRAAAKLNMAQPTISKRIQELESGCGFEVFKKHGRSVTLSPQGAELYEIAEKVLTLLQGVEDIRSRPAPQLRQVGVGVTELVAFTWLPRLVNLVRERHPTITPHVMIDHSAALFAKLSAGELDVIVTSSFTSDPLLVDIPAADVSLALLASPALCDSDRVYSGSELSRFSLISHGPQTGGLQSISAWMRDLDWAPETIEIDSIVAQTGLAVAGMGLAIMPRACLEPLLSTGRLVEVRTAKHAPTIRYRIIYRRHEVGTALEKVAETLQDAADFTIHYEI